MKLLRSIALGSLGLMLALAVTEAAQAGRPDWAPGPPPWAGSGNAGRSGDRPGPSVPEPTGALLFGAGLAATIAMTRRRRAR